MNASGVYVSPPALEWALDQFKELNRDQIALFYCLAISVQPTVKPTRKLDDPFVEELLRYLGAPIRGGGQAVFNPIEGKWRAPDYLFSTVFGRLLNGSHWWTGDEGFLTRSGKGWPAVFQFEEKGYRQLMLRIGAPNLAYKNRLPDLATALLYMSRMDLAPYGLTRDSGPEDILNCYFNTFLKSNEFLRGLFREAEGEPLNFLTAVKPEEEIRMSCYPPSPFSSEPKKNVLLYADDVTTLNKMSHDNEMLADTVRRLIERNAND